MPPSLTPPVSCRRANPTRLACGLDEPTPALANRGTTDRFGFRGASPPSSCSVFVFGGSRSSSHRVPPLRAAHVPGVCLPKPEGHRRRPPTPEGHRRRCFELAWHPLMRMPTPEPMTHDRREKTTLNPEERAELHLSAIRLRANMLVFFWPCMRESATDHLWVAVAGAADHLSAWVPAPVSCRSGNGALIGSPSSERVAAALRAPSAGSPDS